MVLGTYAIHIIHKDQTWKKLNQWSWCLQTSCPKFCYFEDIIKEDEQAGAELRQAQVKLKVVVEVEFGVNVEACHY